MLAGTMALRFPGPHRGYKGMQEAGMIVFTRSKYKLDRVRAPDSARMTRRRPTLLRLTCSIVALLPVVAVAWISVSLSANHDGTNPARGGSCAVASR